SDRALAQVIQGKSIEVLKKKNNKQKTQKKKFFVAKEQKTLKLRAQEYDTLIHSLLEDQIQDTEKILIFSYQDGFVSTDKSNFSQYSICL
ncbi:late transcription unit protein LtuB, partial [Chlamydia sp. 17-3921]|uniref:late transcription unit protein LtuB n=1 Tax=Chlamydia sp. 17-3921 TaxID=2675798 RepID=UPI001F2E7AD8